MRAKIKKKCMLFFQTELLTSVLDQGPLNLTNLKEKLILRELGVSYIFLTFAFSLALLYVSIYRGVAPNAEVKITFCDLVPTRSGRRELVVGFNSKELADVCGSCEVEVKHA